MLIAAIIAGCFVFVALLGYAGWRRNSAREANGRWVRNRLAIKKNRALCWTPDACNRARAKGHKLLVCDACLGRGGK